MSIYPTEPLSFQKLRTYPLANRPNKVNFRQFARPHKAGDSFAHFLESLPRILAAEDLRRIRDAILDARRAGKAILWGIGGHVIKVGLGPLLIDLMNRGFVSGIAMNGAALVHDFEIALVGGTSEDVELFLVMANSEWPRKPAFSSTKLRLVRNAARSGSAKRRASFLPVRDCRPNILNRASLQTPIARKFL